MTFQNLISLVYQAMTVEFTVFGYTINMFQVYVFSITLSVVGIIIRELLRW